MLANVVMVWREIFFHMWRVWWGERAGCGLQDVLLGSVSCGGGGAV